MSSVGSIEGGTLVVTEDDISVVFATNQRARVYAARVVAAVMSLMLIPLVLVIAFAIATTSPGPVFFRQERVGLGGKRFVLWKFRTMCVDAEERLEALLAFNEHDGVLFKLREDPRVTSVGRWLRRLSLDELPQLWNIVRGDMAFVGPRPALPDEVERYAPIERRRLLVRPGLTGLWQVSGRAQLSWADAVRLDLHYVENSSTSLNARILVATVGAVLSGRGAY